MTTPAPAPAPKKAPDEPEPERKAPAGPPPDHDLLLSNGSVVESWGAIPTHYADGDRVWRVVHVTER